MIRNLFLFCFIRFGKLKHAVLIAIHAKVQPNAHNAPVIIIYTRMVALIVVPLHIMETQLKHLILVLVIIIEHL